MHVKVYTYKHDSLLTQDAVKTILSDVYGLIDPTVLPQVRQLGT